MKNWKLWATVGVLGVGVFYLGLKLFEVVSANQTLAKDNNTQGQEKENAIQEATQERQQKNIALKENVELKSQIAKLPPQSNNG
jgi:hypothetical protein